jgi:hypothetical protein
MIKCRSMTRAEFKAQERRYHKQLKLDTADAERRLEARASPEPGR